jgi:hypothetical protein
VRACLVELEANRLALRENIMVVEEEIDKIAKSEGRVVSPLDPVDTSAFDLLVLAQPAPLRGEGMAALLVMRRATRAVTEAARGREGWHLQGTSIPRFYPVLQLHDETVIRLCGEALDALPAAEERLEQARDELERKLNFERKFDEAGAL